MAIPVSRTIADANLATENAVRIRIAKLQSEPINALTMGRLKKLETRLKVEFKDPNAVVVEKIARIPAHVLVGKREREEGEFSF